MLLTPDSLGWDLWSPWSCHKLDNEESVGLPSDRQGHALTHKYEHISSNRAILSKSDSAYIFKADIFYRWHNIWSLTQVVHDTATLEKWVNKHRTRYTPMFCLDVSIPLQTRNTSPIWPRKLSTSLMRLSASFPSGSKVQINLNLHSNLLYIYKNQIFT